MDNFSIGLTGIKHTFDSGDKEENQDQDTVSHPLDFVICFSFTNKWTCFANICQTSLEPAR